MLPRRLGIVNVQHGVPVQCEVVRHQHAMTMEEDALGAHDRRRLIRSRLDHSSDGGLKPHREHVVGIVAKGIIAQPGVGRILQ